MGEGWFEARVGGHSLSVCAALSTPHAHAHDASQNKQQARPTILALVLLLVAVTMAPVAAWRSGRATCARGGRGVGECFA